MNKILRSKYGLLIFTLAFTVSCSGLHQTIQANMEKELSILGLGDSITEGGAEFDSYLFPLDSMLKTAGYHIKFIGPRQTTQNNHTLHHAGFSGKNVEFIAKKIDSIYTVFPADIILLHSGHNHFVEEKPVKGIINAQKKIIDLILQKNPRAIIFVSAVITSGKLPKYEYIPELNQEIEAMVKTLHNKQVVFVDQQKNWDWTKFTIHDKVHPNTRGAIKIGENWFRAINKIIK